MAAFRTKAIDAKLIEEVKSHIEHEDEHALKKIVDEIRAADVADLIEHLKPDERLFIFKLLEPEGAGEVLVEIEPPVQEGIIKELDNNEISDIVQELDSDDAADLVACGPDDDDRFYPYYYCFVYSSHSHWYGADTDQPGADRPEPVHDDIYHGTGI